MTYQINQKMNIEQASDFIERHMGQGCSPSTMRRAIKDGNGPKYTKLRARSPMFFHQSDLLEWISQKTK